MVVFTILLPIPLPGGAHTLPAGSRLVSSSSRAHWCRDAAKTSQVRVARLFRTVLNLTLAERGSYAEVARRRIRSWQRPCSRRRPQGGRTPCRPATAGLASWRSAKSGGSASKSTRTPSGTAGSGMRPPGGGQQRRPQSPGRRTSTGRYDSRIMGIHLTQPATSSCGTAVARPNPHSPPRR
jgi:hypothetical protein